MSIYYKICKGLIKLKLEIYVIFESKYYALAGNIKQNPGKIVSIYNVLIIPQNKLKDAELN